MSHYRDDKYRAFLVIIVITDIWNRYTFVVKIKTLELKFRITRDGSTVTKQYSTRVQSCGNFEILYSSTPLWRQILSFWLPYIYLNNLFTSYFVDSYYQLKI